jgi:hypothetical protein
MNWITIATSCAVITGAVMLSTILPPDISLGPLFVFGCAIPTLVINRRWGTVAAIFCTVTMSITRVHLHIELFHLSTFLWNIIMRFLYFEIFVLVFDCVRRQASALPRADR